jgi:hypothetical protein
MSSVRNNRLTLNRLPPAGVVLPDAVAHEHDLACHASLPEQLVRLSRPGKRKLLRDEWLDLLLLKEVEQSDQILSKQFRFPPFEPLDAVGDHPFPAREKPAGGDVQPEDGGSTKALTTTRTT